MATIAYDSGTGPGSGATSPVRAQSSRAMKIVTGKFTFDTSYPTGGEDISDIFNQFVELYGCLFDDANVATKKVAVDYTAKKVKVFVEDATSGIGAEAANASDQSTIANLRFIAWGV